MRGIVSRIVDGFAGARIAASAASGQLSAQGMSVDPASIQVIAMQYADWSAALAEGQHSGDNPLYTIQAPSSRQQRGNEGTTEILGLIVSGMMVFYVFFTGAAAAQSILLEEEAGTLPRLFTTPTSQSSILGGKFMSSFLLLTVQVVVLVVTTSLIFDINWGEPL
ncbi:MAG: ABC transporter permease subunit, partial [Anaerolineae bacterium]|nr:ABC transporter permease subunit [Anaerolineae bacterium]